MNNYNLFKNKFHELTNTEKEEIRDRIIKEMPCKYSTFYHKLKENSWTLIEMKQINRIWFDTTGDELFENINKLYSQVDNSIEELELKNKLNKIVV